MDIVLFIFQQVIIIYEELYHTVFRALIYFLQENTAITGSVLACSSYRYGLIKNLFARHPAHIVCLYFMEREQHCVQ